MSETTEKSTSRRRFLTFVTAVGIAGAGLAISGVPVRAQTGDLGALQAKLDNDPALRERFIKDPGAVLKENGITLGQKQLDRLKDKMAADPDFKSVREGMQIPLIVGIDVGVKGGAEGGVE